ncbi:hypothetical protein LMG3441_04831 [Achromobacter kerstersii]|uniref:Uncharacterized protein n=2 Tax=Achromobacter kerstersii TaxID=1353890 RepID=A0A6S7BYA8_9BURK|nr:hypothetical protein LMG3441_04831 [Achromobacter kerstersii]
MHASLRITRMHSIERDEDTFKRQRFNKPAGFVNLHFKDSDEFFRTHAYSAAGTIVWLDYVDCQHKTQLDELVTVASSLDCHDIIKITLNANVKYLGSEDKPTQDRARLRLAEFVRRMGNYAPPDLSPADMQGRRFPRTLQACVKRALGSLPAGRGGRYFQILSSFQYADGQPMLTVTGIIFKTPARAACAEFKRLSRIQSWPFTNLDWAEPRPISVPALTAKERMRLDEVLPFERGSDSQWQARLERHLGYKPGGTSESLAHYARYYRTYPHFSRIVL